MCRCFFCVFLLFVCSYSRCSANFLSRTAAGFSSVIGLRSLLSLCLSRTLRKWRGLCVHAPRDVKICDHPHVLPHHHHHHHQNTLLKSVSFAISPSEYCILKAVNPKYWGFTLSTHDAIIIVCARTHTHTRTSSVRYAFFFCVRMSAPVPPCSLSFVFSPGLPGPPAAAAAAALLSCARLACAHTT